MRVAVKIVALLAVLVGVPSVARAQAVIAGTVKDPSGAVLPGVSVEAPARSSSKRPAPQSPTATASTASKTCGPGPTP